MPEAQLLPLHLEDTEIFKYTRKNWHTAGVDNFTAPPGQNPDSFLQLTNILPSEANALLRRRGYRSFKPKFDDGSSVAVDEATPSANAAAVLKARHLYDYENQALKERTIIATVGDGTGASSITNKVIYWDSTGTAQTIFSPSAGANSPRLVSSRDYAYLQDGVATDQKKWTLQWQVSLTAAANASAGNTVYSAAAGLGIFVAGASVVIAGFVTSANNGTFTVVSSTGATVTVNNASGVAETHSGTITLTNVTSKWGIAAPTSAVTVGVPTGGGAISLSLSSVANASGGNTVYTGTSLGSLIPSTFVTITGFVNSANNGTFKVVSNTSTTVTVNNPSGVSETIAAQLSTTNLIYPTLLLNGWPSTNHVGAFDNGSSLSFALGTTQPPPGTYTNPNNVFDGNESTFAFATFQNNIHAQAGAVYSFASLTATLNNATINILSEVPTSGTDGQSTTVGPPSWGSVYYSLDSGTTWLQLYVSPLRPKQWDSIAIPNGQDMGKVQVMIFTDTRQQMYHKVYEINVSGQSVGNGPITIFSGRNYYTVFGNSQTGHISGLSPISASTRAISGGVVPLSNIPVSADPQVDIKYLIATADGGNPSVLYFVAQMDNSVTSYSDGTAEPTLLLQNTFLFTDDNGDEFGVSDNDPPPNGSFPTKHRGRLFMINGSFLLFSKNIAELTTNTGFIAGRYEEAWPPGNQLDLSEEAEIPTGLLSDGQVIYVGTSRHIRRVTGDSAANFSDPEVVFNEVGLLNQDVWQVVYMEGTPVGSVWLTPDYRCMLSDFNTYRDVGAEIQLTLNSINRSADLNSWATFVSDGIYNFYLLAIPTGSNTDPDTLCVLDLRTKKWFIWNLADSPISGLFYFNLTGVPRWLFVDSNGKVRLLDATVALDRAGDTLPVGITHTIQTVWLDFGDPLVRKAINELELETTELNTKVSIEGASTGPEFLSPAIVRSLASIAQNIFGEYKVFFAGYTAKDRFYRLTFTATSTSQSLPSDVLLGSYSLDLVPIHRY